MKNFTLCLFFILSAQRANAQEMTRFYGNDPIVLANPFGAGFIAGTNEYGDNGKYQRFDFNNENVLVKAVKIYLGYKQVNDLPDSITIVMRSVNQDNSPGDITHSIKITSAQLDTTAAGTRLDFALPVSINDAAFFIGLEWDEFGNDAFALYSDADGFGEGADRAWERYSTDYSFHSFNEQSTFSWLIDVDLHIAIIYTAAVGTAAAEMQHFVLQQNTPNPFTVATAIAFSLQKPGEVQLDLFDQNGRLVQNILDEKRSAGEHIAHFKVKDTKLTPGVYAYRLTIDGVMATKLCMVR